MSNWIEHLEELASVETDVKKKLAFRSSAKLIKELAKGGTELRAELAVMKAENLILSNNISALESDKKKLIGSWEDIADSEAALREELAALKAENVELIWGLKDAKLFAVWVECLGRTDCEIYKHELKASADLAINRINKFLDDEDGS